MRVKTFSLILFILFACFLVSSSEKNVNLNNKIDENSSFNFALTGEKINSGQVSQENIENMEYAARTNRANPMLGLLIGGIFSLCAGIAGIAVGAPMWYYSAIGLGFVTDHPGVVEVRPIDGNYAWLWLAYSFGIVFIALGSALFIAGIIMVAAGIMNKPRRVSLFYKNDFDLKLNTACSLMGVNIKI